MPPELSGDDPSLDDAVSKIMSRGLFVEREPAAAEEREPITDRDAHEYEEDGDMDVRTEAHEEAPPESEESKDEQFFELLGEEGQEAEKIPLTEVADIIKQYRQMDGDIATAVIKAESEAYAKQDEVLQAIGNVYSEVATRAQASLQILQAFMPRPPAESLRDQNSPDYDPQTYYAQKSYYEDYVQHMQQVQSNVKEALNGRQNVTSAVDVAEQARENDRMSRYDPRWKAPETRDAAKAEILETLTSKYGLAKEDLETVVSHKAWRMLADLAGTLKTQAKAPEVKKQLQDTTPKLKNGRLENAQRDNKGRFVNEDRARLKQTGSEEDFARMLLRSGALRK